MLWEEVALGLKFDEIWGTRLVVVSRMKGALKPAIGLPVPLGKQNEGLAGLGTLHQRVDRSALGYGPHAFTVALNLETLEKVATWRWAWVNHDP